MLGWDLRTALAFIVSVCVVACLVCQKQFTCELDFLRKSHSLSVCVHASRGSHIDCVYTPRC